MILLPFPPGGIADVTARPLAAALRASPPALAIPQTKAGKMRPLATRGATRPAPFPDKAWWDHDASVLADVVERIGRIES